MKKLSIILLVMAMLLAFTACGDSDESSDDSISVDEGILNVEITLPATFFEGLTEDEIIEDAELEGVSKVVVNKDGSVTYKVSKAQRDEMLVTMKVSIDETISDLVEGEDAVPSFEKIEYNDDLSEFDVYLNTEPDMMTSMYGLTFYFSGAYYQMFDGVSEDSIDVVVNYIDNDTGDILDTSTYKEWLAEQEEE